MYSFSLSVLVALPENSHLYLSIVCLYSPFDTVHWQFGDCQTNV